MRYISNRHISGGLICGIFDPTDATRIGLDIVPNKWDTLKEWQKC